MRSLLPLSIALASLLTAPARADEPGELLSLDPGESTISYKVVHKLHTVRGTSRKAEGKGRLLPDGRAQVMVRVPVDSFDSGNSNRDAHMKEAVEAARFAYVELKAAGDGVTPPRSYPATLERTFQGEVHFHGVRRPVEVPVRLTFEDAGRVRASARFAVSLDSFQVERPSLMFVKIDDAVRIEADLLFRR